MMMSKSPASTVEAAPPPENVQTTAMPRDRPRKRKDASGPTRTDKRGTTAAAGLIIVTH